MGRHASHSFIRRTALIALALSPLSSLLVAAPARADSAPVAIADFAFVPPSLTVAVGTTVTWTNDDYYTHTVTSDAGVFNSSDVAPGSSFTYTFNSAGTFSYHCSIHPTMHGTIVVGAGSGGSTPTPAATAAPSDTPTALPTLTPAPTSTSVPSPTATATVAPSDTPVPTAPPTARPLKHFSLKLSGRLVHGKGANLRVTVRVAGTGQPVVGATVRLDARKVGIQTVVREKTGKSGTVTLARVVPRRAGHATLTVSKAGFASRRRSLTVS
jgi:plastocyanin